MPDKWLPELIALRSKILRCTELLNNGGADNVGAKGLGEVAMVGPAPVIATALMGPCCSAALSRLTLDTAQHGLIAADARDLRHPSEAEPTLAMRNFRAFAFLERVAGWNTFKSKTFLDIASQ
ncbi:hypothetical protein [Neorhizobium petrolearium]|uniref:hypothetical protein n=1 Tax=Neorhizobium petrolearium TaxID=515361 RepID=UPI003F1718D7